MADELLVAMTGEMEVSERGDVGVAFSPQVASATRDATPSPRTQREPVKVVFNVITGCFLAVRMPKERHGARAWCKVLSTSLHRGIRTKDRGIHVGAIHHLEFLGPSSSFLASLAVARTVPDHGRARTSSASAPARKLDHSAATVLMFVAHSA